MIVADILTLSVRMFKSRKMRTFLTVLGIGIGIGAILFLVSLGYGLQRALISQITSSDALLSLDVVQSEKGILSINNDVVNKIKDIQTVKEVATLVSLRGQIEYDGTTADSVANISDLNFLKFSNLKLSSGNLFNDEKNEVIISKAVMKVLNIEDETKILGKEMSISFLAVKVLENGQEQLDLVQQSGKFVVSGIVDDETASFIYFPITKVSGITIDSYSQLKVRVNESSDLDLVRNLILNMGFSVAALSDVVDQANKIFNILQIILAIFGMVALIVSAIGMFNTMTIALMERTHEVGIMKALGASRIDIMLMFISEALIMGFLGGVVGILVGMLGGKVFNFILNILSHSAGGKTIDIFYTPLWFGVTIMIFSAVVGLLTGVWPARRASHLNPLEAVKYK